MSEQVWVAIIVTVGTVIVAGIGSLTPVVVGIAKKLERIRNQVENDHVDQHGTPINMREENDERHNEITSALSQISAAVGRADQRLLNVELQQATVTEKLTGLQKLMEEGDDALSERVDDLEHTLNPKKEN